MTTFNSSGHNLTPKVASLPEEFDEMRVTKRNGDLENIEFDKILTRIKSTGQEAGIAINYTALVMKVIDQLYDKISTTKIDELTAEQCASMSSVHPDYNVLAGRIVVSNHHKNTGTSFSEAMRALYHFSDKHGNSSPLISQDLYDLVMANAEELDSWCDFSRDYLIDYFGFKTLERAYMMKVNGKIVERPQHMWLRVSLGIHGSNFVKARETYDLMSQKYFTHATPTLFNAGTPHPQLSSCFLLGMESDSIDGIYNTLKDCANISKWAGGIGLHIHNVRASGSHIRGTNGSSNGIVPMLRVFNHTAKYVDQCLDPETVVYTKRGAIPIKNIVIGDEVITDDGQFYEIGKVLDSEYTGDFYKMDIQHTFRPLSLTDMHPLWCIKNVEGTDCYHLRNLLDKKLIEPDFIEAKNIDTNDYIGFPIPKYEKDIRGYSEDDCRFHGLFFSGINSRSIYESRGESPEANIIGFISTNDTPFYIQLPASKTAMITFIENYLNSYAIPFEKTPCGVDLVKIIWSRTNRFKFTYEMFYEGIPALIHLPKQKILSLIKGIFETQKFEMDEKYMIITCGFCNNLEQFEKYFTQNSVITEHIRYMLLRLGVLTTGDNNTVKIPVNGFNRLYNIDYFVHDKHAEYFEYNGYLFSCVKNNTLTKNYSGRVIDIEVDHHEHHNFLTHNGLVKNGGGKRNGSFAIYLEPWHADIEIFLQMRKNHGDEELKARDLFYALWIPDLFMERVKSNGSWTLMCPDECPGLSDVYGDAFKELYEKYEASGKGRVTLKARDLWFQVLDAQMETGTPYLLYKDAVNKKSNQKNVGTIKSSNLCTEITEYSDENESAVCNLASIGLPTFLDYSTTPPTFNYEKLHDVTKVVTENLNRIIDRNYYPTEKTRRSNMRHRPIGIGIQGLADTFILMDLAFTSDEAKVVNRHIFETIYHGALECSCELALTEGTYETFPGSPASEGILQFDMWGYDPGNERYDWTAMKNRVKEHGLRNSLLLAPMPTASTSQILGFNECFEPITSNIYSRRTIAGEFVVTNKYLVRDLLDLGLWNDTIKNNVITNNGSIQHIAIIPEKIREKYRTAWEIPMKTVIDMAAERGVFVCQSQSMNTWIEEPSYNSLTSMHFYSWGKGLKTGIYYLRRRAAHQAQQFTIEPEKRDRGGSEMEEDHDICEMCSG